MMRLSPCRFPGLRPFLLSLVVVLTLASKILHILQHLRSVAILSLCLYLPTLFVPDFLVFIFAWLALSKLSGLWSVVGSIVVAFWGAVDLGAVSSQFGFFYVTGAEVRWNAASNRASSGAGLKLLLSGLIPVSAFATLFIVLSWILAPLITLIFDSCFSAIGDAFNGLSCRTRKYLPLANEPKEPPRPRYLALALTVVGSLALLCLELTRPKVPYDHLSETVPFTLSAAFQNENRTCLSSEQQPFPLSDLVTPTLWEPRNGRYKGWRPGDYPSVAELAAVQSPSWAPETWPDGFGRWARRSKNSTEDAILSAADDVCPPGDSFHNAYDPVLDPMRITNLELEVLAPVQQALKDHAIPIKHVFLIEMESARKDVFPLKSDSHLYQQIMEAHSSASHEDLEQLKSRLAAMTPVAEQITGESGKFDLESVELRDNLTAETWKDPSAPGMGGINVIGTVTGSSLSLKSNLGNHCGVGPIPSDDTFETGAKIYQPCLMHILKLFNQLKADDQPSTDMRKQKWRSIFMQSITGEFDDQNQLNENMGFDRSIFKEDIDTKAAKHWHKGMREINYFGYEEPEVYPYLNDTIQEAIANGERLFLSHFTSTTHHPWGLPSEIHAEHYWPSKHLGTDHQPMNKYLNAVHYVDKWLGNIMQLLEETGIANETLVVFVGDHGQAFNEDSKITGTFENGHISNFRVPLIFRHPLLPRLDVHANASSISILPTILDLLINTNSLDEVDKNAASDLIQEYEGQSLLRPFKETHHGRQAWNMGIINTGGTMLSVASAAAPYRLILPLTGDFTYIFSDLETDPYETDVLEDWDIFSLIHLVKRKYGHDAAHWLKEAEKVGRWWADERKRLWNYHEI